LKGPATGARGGEFVHRDVLVEVDKNRRIEFRFEIFNLELFLENI
jgi:hypothetical protein